jgi:hypothetical protein
MKTSSSRSRNLLLSQPLLATLLAGGALGTWPIMDGANAPVLAQVSISLEFRTALQPYGRWERHSRWGDVWVPENRPRDWRPYTVGRWAFTDDWGWYWASDQEEDAWGWIVYHYGRWVLDADFGWVWVPGDEWSPGWVEWRRGTQDVGWAPLPPDQQIEVDVRERPEAWVFVRVRDFTAPRISTVILPEREYSNMIRETVVENRTVELRDRRIAVNPGIAPGIIAAAVGRPLRSFEVRPRVLAGTARIPGAMEVHADEITRGRERTEFRESLRETPREIRPAASISEPRPLGRGEQGRLGDNPPRAATIGRAGEPAQPGERRQQGATQGRGEPQQGPTGQRPPVGAPGRENAQQPRPGTQGLAPGNQEQQRSPQQGQRELPNAQGLNPGEQRKQSPQATRPQEQQRLPQQGQQRELPNTQGLNPREQRNQSPQATRPQEQQRPPRQDQQRELPNTQGLNPREQRNQSPQATRPQEQQRPPQQGQQRELPRTQGLGPREEQRPPQGANQERPPQAQPQRELPRTEGLGGARNAPGAAQGQRLPEAGPQRAPAGAPSTEGRGGDRRERP